MVKGIFQSCDCEKNIQVTNVLVRDLHPDFIRLMSDGYFAYPNPVIAKGSHPRAVGGSTSG